MATILSRSQGLIAIAHESNTITWVDINPQRVYHDIIK